MNHIPWTHYPNNFFLSLIKGSEPGHFLIGKWPKFDFLSPDPCLVYIYTSFLTTDSINFKFMCFSLHFKYRGGAKLKITDKSIFWGKNIEKIIDNLENSKVPASRGVEDLKKVSRYYFPQNIKSNNLFDWESSQHYSSLGVSAMFIFLNIQWVCWILNSLQLADLFQYQDLQNTMGIVEFFSGIFHNWRL